MGLQIQIQTTSAQIGMRSNPATLDMKQRKADQTISAPMPIVHVEMTLPKIQMDQTRCFAESGRKPAGEFVSDNSSYAVQKMYESVGRIAEQGTQLSNIHEPDDKLSSQASYNAYDQFMVDYNMVTMPRSRPEITVIEGKNDIKVTGGTFEHKVQINKPEISYKAGGVEIYMQRMHDIKFSTIETKNKFNLQV